MKKKSFKSKEKERITDILNRLDEYYGVETICYLEHENAWQLLIATILSAQCTDARVNIVTKDLFRLYPTPLALANADISDIENIIHSLGFYTSKARNIKACSLRIVTEFGGEVPSSIEELTSLAGVGRKTANVIRGNIFNEPSIVVDTHVKRISGKLGLTKETVPEKIEIDLMETLPKEHWIRYNMQIITHGRTICKARNPICSECFLSDLCKNACDN
ncbi:MAG: endonuclease III [Lachnospiraceae bacterium]|nr:endonuclease III [Lachnospiraceae bacterium]